MDMNSNNYPRWVTLNVCFNLFSSPQGAVKSLDISGAVVRYRTFCKSSVILDREKLSNGTILHLHKVET